ncbi:MAG: HEAT repeat domain-containing protein [Planctomycetota bacterium]
MRAPTASRLALATLTPLFVAGCQPTAITPQAADVIQPPEARVDDAYRTEGEPEPGEVQPLELTPAQIVVAIAADPTADPDARRDALLTIIKSSAADEPVYLNFYRALLVDRSVDPTVAAAAFTALANHGEPADAERILPWLDSDEAFARWQAAVSLQRLHNPVAIPALIRQTTEDDDADARMAAVTALGQYPRRDVFDALVIALDDRDYGVSRAARDMLGLLTRHDAGDDPRAWIEYASENPRTFLADPRRYTFTPYPGNPELPFFWIKPRPTPKTPVGYTPPSDAE